MTPQQKAHLVDRICKEAHSLLQEYKGYNFLSLENKISEDLYFGIMQVIHRLPTRDSQVTVCPTITGPDSVDLNLKLTESIRLSLVSV